MTILRTRFQNSSGASLWLAIALMIAAGILTGIAGEAGGNQIVAWLTTLAVMRELDADSGAEAWMGPGKRPCILLE
jgi:hypothetical protein